MLQISYIRLNKTFIQIISRGYNSSVFIYMTLSDIPHFILLLWKTHVKSSWPCAHLTCITSRPSEQYRPTSGLNIFRVNRAKTQLLLGKPDDEWLSGKWLIETVKDQNAILGKMCPSNIHHCSISTSVLEGQCHLSPLEFSQ